MKSAHRALLLAVLLLLTYPAAAQEPRRYNFRAIHYDLSATIAPQDQMLTARARVEFEAREASRVVEFELHPALKINTLTTADGKPVPIDRSVETALRVRAQLAEPVASGQKITLIFSYGGILSSAEDSPARDVRLAYISEEHSYLLQTARWFPMTDFPAARYTGRFEIIVPQGLSVVGTGKMSTAAAIADPAAPRSQQPARPAPGREVFTFTVERPQPAGTFLIGRLRVAPVTAEGAAVPVYLPEGSASNAEEYGRAAAQAVTFFSAEFGGLPSPAIGVAQLPDGTVPAYSAPGILFISKSQWTDPVNIRVVARLAAAQWWGNEVLAATPSDAWLTDGLARYCESVYVKQEAGEAGFNKALEDFAVGALIAEDVAPIAQAGRLSPFTSEYNSIVVNKGALVFHMLRSLLGDSDFAFLMKELYSANAGGTATMAAFQRMAQARADAAPQKQNLGPFFSNWLNSTGLPEFKIEFIVQRIRKGFRIIGKVKQQLETFRMPLQIRINTDGNPELKTLEVIGTETAFSFETFGRPKPGGIILDPNNYILKSSPKLRVRAGIARGEELAAQAKFYDAVVEYQRALELQKNNSLASFRIGEALFYQKNYQSAANAFRDALDGDLDLSYKWVEVWSHIYLGKIFDLSGQRDRAVNEYNKAEELNDNTGRALEEIARLKKEPYREEPRH